MRPQNYLLIGLLKIIGNLIIFLHQTEYNLITSLLEEEKHLLQEKLLLELVVL